MLLALRSWPHTSILRRAYTTSTTQPELRIHRSQFRVSTISTLRPEKLVHSDFLVLAGRLWPSFHTQLSLRAPAKHGQEQSAGLDCATRLVYRPDGAKYDATLEAASETEPEFEFQGGHATTTASKDVNKVKHNAHLPFPRNAQGFLYLYRPPGLSLSANSIRFRCVPLLVEASYSYLNSYPKLHKPIEASMPLSEPVDLLPPSLSNPEIYKAFKAGYDLTLPGGRPWSISVVRVARRPAFEYIRMQLLEDKLFSASQLQEYGDIFDNTNFDIIRRINMLYAIGDVFPVRFNTKKTTVWSMAAKGGTSGMRREKNRQATTERRRLHSNFGLSRLTYLFMDRRTKYGRVLPYTGAANVRFELAPGSHPSMPVLCLRIVKITEPVKCVIPDYDGYIHIPEEGALFTRGPPDAVPWICQLDRFVITHSALLHLVPGYRTSAHSR